MAKLSVYEILEIASEHIRYAFAIGGGITIGDLYKIQERNGFELRAENTDAIMDAYKLGLVRGMACQEYIDMAKH
jgi:hypothetical protein